MKTCGLSVVESYLPSRRTFDRRLKTISTDIKERISAMGNLFVSEGLVKPYILAIDSTLLKADKGHVWHVSSMKEGLLPYSGIDTDARWGFSHTPEAGYLDTNFIWYVALILLLLYLLLLTLLRPTYQIIKSIQV